MPVGITVKQIGEMLLRYLLGEIVTKYHNSFHGENKAQGENQTKVATFKPCGYMIALANIRHPK